MECTDLASARRLCVPWQEMRNLRESTDLLNARCQGGEASRAEERVVARCRKDTDRQAEAARASRYKEEWFAILKSATSEIGRYHVILRRLLAKKYVKGSE